MKINSTIVFFISLVMIAISATSQTPNWQWATSGTGGGRESVSQLLIDGNGDMVVGGLYTAPMTLDGVTVSTNANNNGIPFIQGDLFIAKFNSNANLLWVVYPLGVDTNMQSSVRDMAIDPSGNVYAFMGLQRISPNAALVFGSDTIHGDCSLVKFDPNGNVLWHHDFIGTALLSYNIATDNSGNVILQHGFESGEVTKTYDTITVTNPHPLGFNEMVLVKYNSSGSALWAKTIGGSETEIVKDILIDNSGNITVTGDFSSDTLFFDATTYVVNTVPGPLFGPYDYFYSKFDSSGNVLWGKSIPCASATVPVDPRFVSGQNDAGELFLAGRLTIPPFNIGSITVNSPGYFVSKMDVNGNPLWATVIGDTLSTGPRELQIDGLGNLYVSGRFDTDSIMMANTMLYNDAPGATTSDIFIAMINEDDGILGAFTEGGDNDEFATFKVMDNSSMYLSGGYNSNTLTLGSTILTNPNYPNTHMFLTYSAPIFTGLNEMEFSEYYSVYPNPATTEINIQVKNMNATPVSISIMNLLGESLFYRDFTKASNEKIDISKLSPGVYLLNIMNETKKATGKFIKY